MPRGNIDGMGRKQKGLVRSIRYWHLRKMRMAKNAAQTGKAAFRVGQYDKRGEDATTLKCDRDVTGFKAGMRDAEDRMDGYGI